MKWIILFLWILPKILSANDKDTIFVADLITGEPIAFVTISIKGTLKGTITNLSGQANLSVSRNDTIKLHHVAYHDTTLSLQESDTFLLRPYVIMLDNVIISTDTLPLAYKRHTERTPIAVPGLNRLPQEYYDARIKELYPFYSKGLGATQFELLYQFFNKKKYDQLKKLKELYDEEERQLLYLQLHAVRLNETFIMQALDCDSFYARRVQDFYQPPLDYLQGVSDYQLVLDLKEYAGDFKLFQFESEKK